MKKGAPEGGTREAAGCFCMLILGAILTLGCMVIILPGAIGVLAGKPPAGFRRSIWLWLVAPSAGIALVAWLTYGFRGRGGRPRRR
jgi:hypothetical protein